MMARPPPMTRATTPKHMLACRKERCRLPYAYHHSGATQEQHGQQDQSQPQHLYRCLPAASSADRSADTKVGGASGEAHLIGQIPSVLLGHRDTLLATVLAPVQCAGAPNRTEGSNSMGMKHCCTDGEGAEREFQIQVWKGTCKSIPVEQTAVIAVL